MSETESQKKTPVRITDTTFRDGHQSSLATRLRWEDIEPVAEKIDAIGFHSVEVWGGATFDVLHRFLGEDPWERPRRLKKLMPNTPFQMLLRGQNLVGYRNYPDDVVEAFVEKAAEVGIDIFRVFDALNDERNFEKAFEVIIKCGKHIQACISYSLTERRLGGPVFNLEYYVNKAKAMESMGAHSFCVKDMAGILSPYDAYLLISELKKNIAIPIQLHTHYTSGMASMTYMKAIEAGVDVVDCAMAPFALRSSQPASEPIVVALQGTDRDTGLKLHKLFEVGEFIETIAPKYRHFLDTSRMAVIDTGVLMHQIPGGMQSNMVNQLREADALDRLHEVHEELPITRKALGYPPLVTPTSQIVGVQAVMNVLMGRWNMVSNEVKDYCYGLYGTPPAPVDPEVRKQVLVGYERGEEPIDCRPADILEPELEKAKEDVKELSTDMGDVLIYALYPRTGMRFLKVKYGKEDAPPEWKAKSLQDVQRENDLVKKALAGELVEKHEAAAAPEGARTYDVYVEGEVFQVAVTPAGEAPTAVAPSATPPRPSPASPAPSSSKPVQAAKPAPAAPAAGAVPEGGTPVKAPMPGTVISLPKKEGDAVKKGETVVVLEAMKMENALSAPCDGTVASIHCTEGQSVSRNQLLLVIES